MSRFSFFSADARLWQNQDLEDWGDLQDFVSPNSRLSVQKARRGNPEKSYNPVNPDSDKIHIRANPSNEKGGVGWNSSLVASGYLVPAFAGMTLLQDFGFPSPLPQW